MLAALLVMRDAMAESPPPDAPAVVPAAPSKPDASGAPALTAPTRPPTWRERLEWDERWHRFRPIEYATTAATGAASMAVFLFVSPSDHPKWVGPILFDTAVRNALRLHTRTGLEIAATSSSIMAYITPTQALIDSIVLPAVARDFDTMWQLGMMDAQSFALSGLVVASLYDTTGRARPSYSDCKAGTSVDPLCNAGTFASFPSGHTAVAMTGAGLMCAHHGALPLYGGGAPDVVACAEGLTIATTVGVMRLMADRHYASDVLTGGAIGFFSGYALPRLLHYWKRPPGEVVNSDWLKLVILPGEGSAPLGVQAVGMF